MNGTSRVDSRPGASTFWGAGAFPPPPSSADGKRSRFGAHLRGSIRFTPDLPDEVRNFLPPAVFDLLKNWENQAKDWSDGATDSRRPDFRPPDSRQPDSRAQQAGATAGGVKTEQVSTEPVRNPPGAKAGLAAVEEQAVEAEANLEQIVHALSRTGGAATAGSPTPAGGISAQSRRQLGQMASNAETAAKAMIDLLGRGNAATSHGGALLLAKAEAVRSKAVLLGECLRQPPQAPHAASAGAAASVESARNEDSAQVSAIAGETLAAAQKLERMVGSGASAEAIDALAGSVAELTARLRKGLGSSGAGHSGAVPSSEGEGALDRAAQIAGQALDEAKEISRACKQAKAELASPPAPPGHAWSGAANPSTAPAHGAMPGAMPGGAPMGHFHSMPHPTIQPDFLSAIRNMMGGPTGGMSTGGFQNPWSAAHGSGSGKKSSWLRDLLFPSARIVDYLQRNSLERNAWMEGHVPTTFRPSGRFEPMVRL